MPKIILKTEIRASREIVFDLARSIDLHKISTENTHEEAVGGRTGGLIELNEYVEWRAKHFGIYQNLATKITAFERPTYFVDEMIFGAFKRFKHTHQFEEKGGCTWMIDIFDYTSPLGFLGKCADVLFLKKYMTDLLTKRNEIVKQYAESDQWREVLQ